MQEVGQRRSSCREVPVNHNTINNEVGVSSMCRLMTVSQSNQVDAGDITYLHTARRALFVRVRLFFSGLANSGDITTGTNVNLELISLIHVILMTLYGAGREFTGNDRGGYFQVKS